MARIQLNIDQDTFDGAGFEPVPLGPYKVNIYSVEVGEVKNGENKGKPRVNFQFRIQDGETSPEGKKQGNRRLFLGVNAFSTPNKKDPSKTNQPFDLISIGKAIGLSLEQINNLDTDEWQGEELQLSVSEHRERFAKNPSTNKYDIATGQYDEVLRGFRSLASAETSAAATGKVLAGAGAGAGSKFNL